VGNFGVVFFQPLGEIVQAAPQIGNVRACARNRGDGYF
jgi:hypothetical protein